MSRNPDVLPEDSGLVPGSYMKACSSLELQFPRILDSLLASVGTVHIWCIYTHVGKTSKHIKIINLSKMSVFSEMANSMRGLRIQAV